MRKNFKTFAAVSILLLAACNSATENKQATQADSVGTAQSVMHDHGHDHDHPSVTNASLEGTWVLNALTTPETGDKPFTALFKDKIPSLTFATKENKVEGNNGCNGIGGTYESKEGNSIKIGDKLVGTMMHCEGVAYNEFMKALETVTTFDVHGDELLFISGDIVVMKFTKQ